jgi:uncharacterized protein YgiM (DUF1202 family)
MKKFILLVAPLLLAVIIFFGVTLFLDTSSGKGALQVTSIPKASVYLDDKKIGNTPLCKCEPKDLIKTGEYTIKLIADKGDFNPFEEKITINKSTLTVVDREFLEGLQGNGSVITLSPISDKKTSELLVISVPKDANVFLDNNAVGTTPLILKDVTESDHNLSVTKDGYKDRTIGIRTVTGYKVTSLISLGINPIVSSPSAAPIASIPATATIQKVLILDTPNGFLRVRESNSTESPEITRVSEGETFELIDDKQGWFEIKLNSPAGEGKTGWISSQYAKKQ